MWFLTTIVFLLCALAPALMVVAAAKFFWTGEIDLWSSLGFLCTVSQILFRNGKDGMAGLSRFFVRASDLALHFAKFFSELSLKIEKLFSADADQFLKRNDDPILDSQYRNRLPASITLAFCLMLVIAAAVGYFSLTETSKNTEGRFVVEKIASPQEANKGIKTDRLSIVTRFEDRFAIGALGCDGCGGPDLIPLPPSRPNFHIPRARPFSAK
jgi:hypothetical protein